MSRPARFWWALAGLSGVLAAASWLAAADWELFRGAAPVLLGLAGAVAATWRWLDRRSRPAVSTPAELSQALEALAVTVESQWRAEAARRGLTSPIPVQVRWQVTRRPVADRPWAVQPAAGDDVVTARTDGTDRRQQRRKGSAAARRPTAAALLTAGTIGETRRMFESLAQHRLVILGEAGSGKTAASILMTLDILAHRRPGDPVPVIVSLSGWDPDAVHLADHIAAQLARDYRYLANPEYGRSAPTSLVTGRYLTALLDGLSEVAPDKRPAALAAINESGLPQLVLTARADEYEQATAAHVMTGAPVIELEPVGGEQAIAFLSEGCPAGRLDQWQPVFAAMRADPQGPLATALATPLMLSLARQVYTYRSPAELLDRDGFADRENVEDHLLDGLVAAAYRGTPHRADLAGRRYDAAKAVRWLGEIAREGSQRYAFDLAWWRLPRLVPWPRRAAASVLIFVAAAGLLGILLDQVLWPVMAGAPLIFLAITRGRDHHPPPPLLGWRLGWVHLRYSLAFGARLALRVLVAVFAVVWLLEMLSDRGGGGPLVWLVVSLIAGVGVGVVAAIGRAVSTSVPTSTPSPIRSFRAHCQYLLVAQLIPAMLLATLLSSALHVMWNVGLGGATLTALYLGIVIAVAFFLPHAAGQYLVTVGNLASRRRMPWRLLRFLQDAQRRGILRQQGATHQFRHARLQQRLAAAPGAASPAR
jgi:hypothetical protein